ncbi:hypothetical protein SAY87_003009 [Trapa incisa]|uniref:Chalcone-flavonone isomerase family protein n=1 Tax=Trapa incisa TaxID=236973 RepID=A0AAN7QIG3_9MYRT|nr:hypothetical protein SAY87_003009 [Trapa incisa]
MQGVGLGATSASGALLHLPSPITSRINKSSCGCFQYRLQNHPYRDSISLLSIPLPAQISARTANSQLTVRAAASVGNEPYVEEPATNTKFATSLILPGCSSPLSLLGTGYREKVFAIIGVKVYAAGLYANPSLAAELKPWKGKSASDIQGDGSLYSSIFQAPLEKSLQIILVRDIDGKIFWNALDEAITPRIKTTSPIDESALSTFRGIFQGRSLKKGTCIFLTWLDNSKMLVSVSSNDLPSEVDATIESTGVTFALFDVFLGDSPVSPSLKASVVNGLLKIIY